MTMAEMRLPFLFVMYAVLLFYILLHGPQLVLLLVSFYRGWQARRGSPLNTSDLLFDYSSVAPPVTVLAPAYNEEAGIVDSVNSLLALEYPRLEVIVINDGSKDGTLAAMKRSFALRKADILPYSVARSKPVRAVYVSRLHPNLIVLDKDNGGKSDALNAGLNFSRTPWVCCVDSDSVLEPDALLRALRPALEDNTVVVSSGIVRIANGCHIAGGRVLTVALPPQKLARFQAVEYLQDFLAGRMGWSAWNGLLIVSGAFGVFRADSLRAIGGYSRDTVTEDMELIVRIHRYHRERGEPYRVVFVPDPVCWTEVPVTLASLRRQRRRWHRGLMEVLALHRGCFFRPSAGVIGSLVLPYFSMLLVAPLAEMLGYALVPVGLWMGWVSRDTALLYLFLTLLLGTAFSTCAVLLEEITYHRYASLRDLATLFIFAVAQHLGYQQMISWWRLEGLYEYFRGRRHWGEQKRVGFQGRASIAPAAPSPASKSVVAR